MLPICINVSYMDKPFVGYAFATKERCKVWFIDSWRWRKHAKETLAAEIKELFDYLDGFNCVCEICDRNGNVVDCILFFKDTDSALENAKKNIDDIVFHEKLTVKKC